MKKDKFIEELAKLNIEITDNQLNLLEQYYDMLIFWNNKINLTTIVDKEDVYLKHFYDSLTVVKVIDLNKVDSLCDVETGAGFPGIVLKILFPKLKITLIDSLNKRINFLNEVIAKLGLTDITTIHIRVEEYGIVNREKYDLVIARAVAPLNILLEYCVPLTKINGYFIAMKANVDEEIEASSNALQKLNSKIEDSICFTLPVEQSKRTIIKIRKFSKTDKKFPRKYNEIKKRPL